MESMHNSKFDHKVRSKFEDFTPPVPKDLWEKIETQLDVAESIKIKPIKRSGFSFLLYGAVAATVLIAFAFWRFSDAEEINLNEPLEVHTSKNPFEINETLKENNQEAELQLKGSVNEADHPKVVESGNKLSEKSNPNPQIAETVDVTSTKTNLGSGIKLDDLNIAYVEPIYSSSFNELPILEEKVLPFIDTDIMEQASAAIQEDFIEKTDEPKNKRLGISTILNLLAKGFVNENGNSIEFSHSDEGILKLDIKRGLAKSKE